MQRPLGSKNVVLLGIGHTHASLIKNYAMSPIEKINLIGISNFPNATYSGMLPGVLSGQYHQEEMEINLPRLAAAANIPLILDPVTKIDVENRRIHFQERPSLRYDLLSVATGSEPAIPPTKDGCEPLGWRLITIKPMQTFLERLESGVIRLLEQKKQLGANHRFAIDIVGGGLGSVEIALCIEPTLKKLGLNSDNYRLRLISGSHHPPDGCIRSVAKKVSKIFRSRGIEMITGKRVKEAGDQKLYLDDQTELQTDLCLYVGSAKASNVNHLVDVSRDKNGFIITNGYLQSIDRPEIWSAGDSGSMKDFSLPKAGVYAVRQGPVMWENLQRWAAKLPLTTYQPQTDFLKLINTGCGSAIGQWKGLSFQGKWVWSWKNRIDGRFIKMYQNPPRMMEPPKKSKKENETQMRCLGCGGKVGSASLRQVLSDLVEEFDKDEQFSPIRSESSSDDVSITVLPDQTAAAITSVDTVPSPISDPWHSGRIAVLHSLSDLWCSGVQPHHIHTSVEIPTGSPIGQQDYLWETMHGICYELRQHKVRLSGGHSMEGPRLTISVTATGYTDQNSIPQPKSGADAGDVLILTKKLGTGIVLAGSMQGKGHFLTYQSVIQSMLTSNAVAMEIAKNFEIHSMTDVTGFGLLGHLIEMLGGRSLAASVDFQAINQCGFEKIEQLVDQSVHSTMRENNELFLSETAFEESWKESLKRPDEQRSADEKVLALELMMDPQTSGGILLACPQKEKDGVLQCLNSAGQTGTVIGEIHKNMTGRAVQWRV